MAEFTSYTHGTPNWVDVMTNDPDATKAFYSGLFGWEPDPTPMPDAGGYEMFLLRGKFVAAGQSMPKATELQPVVVRQRSAQASTPIGEVQKPALVGHCRQRQQPMNGVGVGVCAPARAPTSSSSASMKVATRAHDAP